MIEVLTTTPPPTHAAETRSGVHHIIHIFEEANSPVIQELLRQLDRGYSNITKKRSTPKLKLQDWRSFVQPTIVRNPELFVLPQGTPNRCDG